MAGYFSKIPSDLKLLPDRYFNLPLYKDEIWPNVQGAFDFVGFRDEAYFPSGDVSCRPDGSASYLIDPALNTKAFLDVISAQTGTSLAEAEVTLGDARAPAHMGAPTTPTNLQPFLAILRRRNFLWLMISPSRRISTSRRR
jgi:hypothetical protein